MGCYASYRLGSELQATNEELETTNEELSARTAELMELTKALADEQARLHSIVYMAPFYVMILRGPRLLVELVNPRYEKLLAGRVVIGQSFADLFADEPAARVVVQVQNVYQSDRAQISGPLPGLPLGHNETAAPPDFRYTIIPLHDSSGRVDGILLYAEDVATLALAPAAAATGTQSAL